MYKTPKEFINKMGGYRRVAVRVGVSDKTLHSHVTAEKLPARWRELNSRDVSPLHGWRKVHCDNGEIRFAHSVVTEVAIDSLESKKRNLVIAEQRRLNKRLADLRNMIDRIGAKQLLDRPHFIERFNEWLEQHYAGVHRREGMVRTALDQFIMETENAQ